VGYFYLSDDTTLVLLQSSLLGFVDKDVLVTGNLMISCNMRDILTCEPVVKEKEASEKSYSILRDEVSSQPIHYIQVLKGIEPG
jgi:hypothetical protein